MRSIIEIRRLTFIKINQTIDLINEINKILDPRCEITLKKEEDNGKISLPYLRDSIDLLDKYINELKEKVYLVKYMFDKSGECYEKYNLILEKSKE